MRNMCNSLVFSKLIITSKVCCKKTLLEMSFHIYNHRAHSAWTNDVMNMEHMFWMRNVLKNDKKIDKFDV